MPSTLNRMFTYAKTSASEALENYTKAHAGDHDDQIQRYLSWLSTIEVVQRPRLVVLAGRRLPGVDAPFLSWTTVDRYAVDSREAAWADLAEFLEEMDMVTEPDQPIG